MSNIFITDIVGTGTYAIPTNDTELAAATSGFDTILSGIANLAYDRVLAWVEDQEGPDGAEGVRTLNCLVEKFTYLTKECPSETEVDTTWRSHRSSTRGGCEHHKHWPAAVPPLPGWRLLPLEPRRLWRIPLPERSDR